MKAIRFIKENLVWLIIITAYLIFTLIYAVWYANHPTLSFDTGSGPALDSITVSKGDTVYPPQASELSYNGFTLEGWYTDEEFNEAYNGGALEKSMTVYANWQPLAYTVSFNTPIGVLFGDKTASVEYGSTLEYEPRLGATLHDVTGWYIDDEDNTPYIPGETVITSDTDVWAKLDILTSDKELSAPVIYISCATEIDKDRYSKCTVIVEDSGAKYHLDKLSAQIRGRGNSTWNYEKKPYRIKFDEKVDLFGMGKAKDWVLLANTVDMSMLRNLTVYRMAQQFESLQYTTDCEFAHVYVNDDYLGLYLVVEQVEEGKNRVEIGDGLDRNGEICAPEDTGFLMECGSGDSTGGQKSFRPKSYGSVYTDYVVIKSPEPDLVTAEHLVYIKEYYEDVQKAIAEDDYDTLCELVDIQSFADSFICTQYVLSGDMGYVFFAYKEPEGKLFLGPLWDYDQSAGVSEHGGKNYKGYSAATPHTWYVQLIKNEKFRELVKQTWIEHYDYIHGIPDMLYGIAEQYKTDIDLNYIRWDGFLGSKQWRSLPQVDALKTYPEHVDYYIDWLNDRVAWIEDDLGIAGE